MLCERWDNDRPSWAVCGAHEMIGTFIRRCPGAIHTSLREELLSSDDQLEASQVAHIETSQQCPTHGQGARLRE